MPQDSIPSLMGLQPSNTPQRWCHPASDVAIRLGISYVAPYFFPGDNLPTMETHQIRNQCHMYPVIVCSRKDTLSFAVTNPAPSDGKGSLLSGRILLWIRDNATRNAETRAGLSLCSTAAPRPGNHIAAENIRLPCGGIITRW